MGVVKKSGKNRAEKVKTGKNKSGKLKKTGKGQVWRKKDQKKIYSKFINCRTYKQLERVNM